MPSVCWRTDYQFREPRDFGPGHPVLGVRYQGVRYWTSVQTCRNPWLLGLRPGTEQILQGLGPHSRDMALLRKRREGCSRQRWFLHRWPLLNWQLLRFQLLQERSLRGNMQPDPVLIGSRVCIDVV